MGQFYNGINEQIQHIAELSQKICLCTYINGVVFIRGLPSLGASGKHELFVTKQGKNGQSSLAQTACRINMNMLCHCS